MEGLLRLARKAGRIVVGVALTKDSVRAGRVRAVWIADDLLAKRSQSLIDAWRATGVVISGSGRPRRRDAQSTGMPSTSDRLASA